VGLLQYGDRVPGDAKLGIRDVVARIRFLQKVVWAEKKLRYPVPLSATSRRSCIWDRLSSHSLLLYLNRRTVDRAVGIINAVVAFFRAQPGQANWAGDK
jgi:hypothetical protein